MSDALENKAVEILDKSQAAIGVFADKLTEMAKQYGPDVADAALQMARIDALSGLLPAIVIACTLAYACKKAIPPLIVWTKGADSYNPGPVFAWIFGGGITAAIFIWASTVVLDIWRWVGIFEPKLWLAKRIFGL